jgi:hypothetical protein
MVKNLAAGHSVYYSPQEFHFSGEEIFHSDRITEIMK